MAEGQLSADLAAKVERLEAQDKIRHLVAKYALAVDMRDLNAIVSLHVDDVGVRGIGRGRVALKQHFDRTLRNFTMSSHHIGNHLIEFQQSDHATGVVYCRCEHEIGDKWIVMNMLYLDSYERRDGIWYFARQRFLGRLYATGLDEPPIGPQKVRWPGRKPADGNFHDPFPAYRTFWSETSLADEPIVDVDPDHFITALLRGAPIPER